MNIKLAKIYWHRSLFILLLLGLAACSRSDASESPGSVTLAVTPRQTEAPTLTKSTTPTQLPIVTRALPVPTRTSEPLLGGPLVAFPATNASGEDYALILDLGTGLVRKLGWDNRTPTQIEWQNNGCNLDVTVATASGMELIDTDLHNRQPKTIFTGGKRINGEFLTWPTADPSGKWIAYTVLSGKQTYAGAEFQNIEVEAVSGNAPPFVLTTRGGATKAVWSPNGEHLSYSDYDSAGVAQVYVSKPDGTEKLQLTHFTVTDTNISTIRWSPTGKALAFTTRDRKGYGSLWIVLTDGSKLLKATIKGASEYVVEMWWGEDSQTIAAYVRSASGEAQSDAVYWIDPGNGTIVHTLEASNTPDKLIAQPFPIGGIQVVGFIGDRRVFFYDMKTKQVEEKRYTIDWEDLTGPAQSSPALFQGEAACGIH